jgi:hypothetical protein
MTLEPPSAEPDRLVGQFGQKQHDAALGDGADDHSEKGVPEEHVQDREDGDQPFRCSGSDGGFWRSPASAGWLVGAADVPADSKAWRFTSLAHLPSVREIASLLERI